MTNQKPKVIVRFEPSPSFDLEFLEFLEEVLKFEENKEQKEEVNNPPHQNRVLFESKLTYETNKK